MNILKAYYYLFYKLYKFWDYISVPKFWSDFKAGVSIVALEIWFLGSIFIYYKIFFNPFVHLSKYNFDVILIALFLSILKYFTFYYNSNWRKYNKEFDKLSKKKNRIGSWVVFGIAVFIVLNLIFSFYLMSQIDWSQYR